MLKKLLTLLFLLGISVAAEAQANFRPGYVLPLSGDTLRGEVDYRGERRNSQLCRFRAAADAAVTEYTPAQLRGYGFADQKYYQALVLPGTSATRVFGRLLVFGKVSLFEYTNSDDKELYYASTKPEEPLRALVQRDTVITEYRPNERREVTTKQRVYPFRIVLRGLMLDCPKAQALLVRTELIESQLIKVFATYNACANTNSSFVAKPQKARVALEVLVGGQQAKTTFDDDVSASGDDKHELASGFRPTYGLGLAITPGGSINHKLSLHLQARYIQQRYGKDYQGQGAGLFAGEKVHKSVRVRLSSIQLPLMLRYTLPAGRVRPYLQAGGLLAYNAQREGYKTTFPPRAIGSVITEEMALRAATLGYTLGAGLNIPLQRAGSVQLEAQFDRLDMASDVANRLSPAKIVSVMAGYTFGKQ